MNNPAAPRSLAAKTLMGIAALLLVVVAGCHPRPDPERAVSEWIVEEEYLHTYIAFETNGLVERISEKGTTVDLSGTDMVLPAPDSIISVSNRTLRPTNTAGFAAFVLEHNNSWRTSGVWVELRDEERCVVITVYKYDPYEDLLDLMVTECLGPPGQ